VKASAIEFRLRIWIQFIIVAIAIWAPWVQPWNLKLRISTLEWLALEMSRSGVVTFAVAVPIVIVFGSVLAALAAGLRVWGTAYLGSDIMQHGEMQARGVVAAGPYRYVRNPLYLGTWLMMMAISLLLTPSGALFLVVVSAFFFVRKILGEEAFLANKLDEPYQQYLRAVPRILPKLRPVIAPADARAHWITAIITELMPIGTLITVAVVPWTYDNTAALEGILISFVVSLIVRGLMKSPISTCVFLAVAGASWGLVHLSIERSTLIGFGAALVTWAVMPRRPASPAPTSDAP
jgi:protein-S-isoprenylcysteine O-methyltransferase Ste14